MAKDTKNAVYIDNVEYDFEELTDHQRQCVKHIADLDRKINSATFQIDQLNVGRDAFMAHLKASLAEEPKVDEAE